jgi:hypothetical protein
MHNKISSQFPTCSSNNCIEVHATEQIYVLDLVSDKCKVASISEISISHFCVLNPSKKDIYFLAIDKCIFTDSSHKKCDFAIFDNTLFCFIEIKDTPNRTLTHKKKSVEQLKVTITKFKEKIDFTGYTIEAIISWRYTPMRPAATTLMQSAKLDLFENYGVKLLEGNQKEFS